MSTLKPTSTRRIAALIFGIVATSLGSTSTVSADAAVARNRIRVESQDQVDGRLSEACGVAVTVDSRFNILVLEFRDGRSKIHINSWSTLSSPEGAVSTIGTSMIQFEAAQMIDNADGTHTVAIPHREAVSSVYLIDGDNMTDGGRIEWELRLVIDDATGALLSEHEIVVQTTGRFPVFKGDGGALPVLCDALTT